MPQSVTQTAIAVSPFAAAKTRPRQLKHPQTITVSTEFPNLTFTFRANRADFIFMHQELFADMVRS